jgi:hypothetical protein
MKILLQPYEDELKRGSELRELFNAQGAFEYHDKLWNRLKDIAASAAKEQGE